MQRKTLLKLLSSVAATTVLIVSTGAHAENQVVKVGTIAGPDEQTWAVVQKVARSEGLDVKIVTFNDYVQPNAALDAGDLDANSFQHQPYLDSQVKQRGYKIVTAGLTYISPIGIYSKKHKSFAEIPDGGKIAIQNDPTNGGRSLLLLQDKGFIKLKAESGLKPSVADIIENPKKLKFIEVEAAQTPRSLEDVDAASINTNYATQAGLTLNDAILKEDAKTRFA